MTTGLADLHRHLDGSLRWQTVTELAAREAIPVPDERAVRFHVGMGLTEALSKFAFTLSSAWHGNSATTPRAKA
jgi:adenosine deaminase